MSIFKTTFKIILFCLVLLLCLGSSFFYFFGNSSADTYLIPPYGEISGIENNIITNPADYGLSLQNFTVPLDDGTTMRAALISPAPENTIGLAIKQRRLKELLPNPTENSQKSPLTIILCHEWGGRLESLYHIASYFTAAGYNCLAFDQRGHGTRPTVDFTYGKLESSDVSRLISYACKHFPNLGNFGVFGLNTGCGTALYSAKENNNIRSLVLLNGLTTVKDFVWNDLIHNHTKISSYVRYFLADQCTSFRLGQRFFDLAPAAAASQVNIPALVISNDTKDIFTSQSARRLYNAIDTKEKALYTPILFQNNIEESKVIPSDEIAMYALIIQWFRSNTHPPMPDVLIPVRRVPLPQKKD